MTGRSAYAEAGVDVAAGDRAVDLLRSRLPAIGGFGAVYELPPGFQKPLLVSSTDGVGTKTDIARRLGRYDTIGQDLVAMCADDIVCHGAAPAFFLDYIAVGRLVPERVAELVGGVVQACESIGCSLVGGETAEHPGLMEDDAFDIAGFCVGFVERDDLVDEAAARAGDVVLGLASSGLHANGYSLVRRLLDDGRLSLTDELLTPTRLYAPIVLELLAELRRKGTRIGGLAHITGGGLSGNLPRAVGAGLGVRIDPHRWPQPDLFERIAAAAGIDGAEMRATFNCGIGFAVVVPPGAAELSMDVMAQAGVDVWRIGEVVPVVGGAPRYIEA